MPPPYPSEFRKRVLDRADEPGVTVEDAAREFGVSPNTIRNWRQKLAWRDDPVAVRRGEEAAELGRLRRENARLREERDVLKKAAAFFAGEERRRK